MRATLLAVLLSLPFAACSVTVHRTVESTGAGAAATDGQDDGGKKPDEHASREKELRQKQHELEQARAELRIAGVERRGRTLAVELQRQKAAAECDKARQELEVFLSAEKGKELEEKKIHLDGQKAHADESKDELAELESMYKDDEFAKKTKELVLKRSRRQLELAERSLAVANKEHEILEHHTLPARELELRNKLRDAEGEVQKAAIDAEKAALELDLAERKAKDHIDELERDVAELGSKPKERS